jgi:hypothetical protein
MHRVRLEMPADGRVFDGSPVSVVEQMRSIAFCPEPTFEGYILWVSDEARAHFGIDLDPRGETPAELASDFLAAIDRAGIAKLSELAD